MKPWHVITFFVFLSGMAGILVEKQINENSRADALRAERDSIINHAAGEMRTARLQLKLADARIHELEQENTGLRIKHGEPLDSTWVSDSPATQNTDGSWSFSCRRIARKDTAEYMGKGWF